MELISNKLINYENINCFISIDEIYKGVYYFLIGFIYDRSIYLLYFYYNPSTKEITLHSSVSGLKDKKYNSNYDEYIIKNKGLTCQVLYYKGEDLIVCLDYVYVTSSKSYLTFSYLKHDKDTKIISYKYQSTYYQFEEVKCIKSTYGQDRTKAFFCLYLSTGKLNCFLLLFSDLLLVISDT